MRTAFALLAFLSVAFGLSIPGLPDCASNCVTSLGNCNQLDINCICSDTSLISGLACCVSKTCDSSDQEGQ